MPEPSSRSRTAASILKINASFLFGDKATAAEYKAGLNCAIARGWLDLHESGTYVRILQAGTELFAHAPS